MNLRLKFIVYISLLIMLIIAGIAFSIFLAQKQLLMSQLEENRQRIFKYFSYTCQEALVVKDEIQVFNTIKSVIKTHNPAIVYAGFISPSETVLFNSRDTDQEGNLKPRILKVTKSSTDDFVSPVGEKIREFSMPLYLENENRGTIRVGFSQTYLESQIDDGLVVVGRQILRVSILALLVGLVMANILAFYLNKPISVLAKAADDIGDGNLDVQVNISRKDELGKLGMTFNQMARKLKELDELKDSFVSSVSHELRSPLTAINGYCDYLIEGLKHKLPPEKQEKSLKIMKDATVRLTDFINNILDLAKIKSGTFEIRKMPVKLSELVGEIVSLFQSLAAHQKKTLDFQIPNDLADVEGDPEKIKQVITNLIGNAMKFTPENGSITVSAHLAQDTPRFVEVWIADTGIGIPPESLSRVFDKFYQVQEGQTNKPKGTGLGLAIVVEIVKMHEGRIWVESTLGKGSIFKFTLPVYQGGNTGTLSS